MNNDISSIYTKTKNKQCGRRGYCSWKQEKISVISPKDYGEFVQSKRKNKNGRK